MDKRAADGADESDCTMDVSVKNLLYRRPELYELMYPEPDDATPNMCRRMFDRFLGRRPASILDIGCGTARDLNALARDGAEGWGVDFLPEAIRFAKERRPHLHLQVGDMRELRLGRTFDAILSLGSVLLYALSDADLDATLRTFAAHAHAGTLLVLDLDNAAGFLPGGSFRETRERRIESPTFNATATSVYSFDRRAQQFIRRRTWRIDGEPPVEDFCRYRMFFPAELARVLAGAGFHVVGMHDNKELIESDLTAPTLYVAAKYEPSRVSP